MHNTQDIKLKNALISTGILAVAATAVAWLLRDDKHREKVKDTYSKVADKTKELVSTATKKHDQQMVM